MTLKEIQIKLYEKLKSTGWGEKLKLFLLSEDFTHILDVLYKESQENRKFTPILKNIFTAFEECPYNDLKVVLIGQSPYPTIYTADGMAFSCSNIMHEEKALSYIFNEIATTVYKEDLYGNAVDILRKDYDLNLKRWANQGILLLNMALTCEIGKVNSHNKLWEPFMIALLDMLNTYNTGIIYIFMGDKIKHWHKYISSQNYKFFTMNPITAVYSKDNKWHSGDLFNQVNKVLEGLYGEKIIW